MHAKAKTLTPELLHKIDACWRAANYLPVGQIYLYDNPLLKRSLTLEDVKHRLLGQWGRTPGQNFIYAHLNRVIKKYDIDMIYVSGPGHGGPAVVGNTYLEGTYSEIYPNISQDEAGLRKLFFQHPDEVLYRSAEPMLPQERLGSMANVVFPTGIDRRDDLGSPERFDSYYGMADSGGVAAEPKGKV